MSQQNQTIRNVDINQENDTMNIKENFNSFDNAHDKNVVKIIVFNMITNNVSTWVEKN